MATTVLQLRMEALARHLMDAADPNTWIGTLQLTQKPDMNLWQKAVEGIGKEAENLLSDLQAVMASSGDPGGTADAEKQWGTYFHIYQRSHEIFRESLELLGGLALRDRLHEEYACRFADELISECAVLVGKQTSFAIPATEDALTSTLRRVARVSFPDWHLWALPLVAHEYGQVVVRETTSLGRFVDELAQRASQPTLDNLYNALKSRLPSIASGDMRTIASDSVAQAEREPATAATQMENLARMLQAAEPVIAELAQATSGSIKDCLDDATSRAQVLVADAFATYTTGPAYACAALMLRLSPNMPGVRGRPSDEERAETILAALAEMDAAQEFGKVAASLRTSWELLLAGSGSHDPPRQVQLDAAQALGTIKIRMLREQVQFTKADWLKAHKLGNAWFADIDSGQPEVSDNTPDISGLRLRDVLNAAWDCRLQVIEKEQPEDVGAATEKVTKAARRLCDSILAGRTPLASRPDFGGPAPRPGVS